MNKPKDHELLVKAAEQKWERDQLIKAAEAKWESENRSAPQDDPSESIETGVRGLTEGITAGLSEPVISELNAIVGNLINSGFDAQGIKEFIDKAIDQERIAKAYKDDVNRRRDLKQKYPAVQIGTEVSGAILSPANKIFGALGKATGMAAEALPGAKAALHSKGVLLAPVRGAARATKSGIQGATTAVSAEGTKRLIEGNTGFIQDQDQMPSMTEMALLGGKMGAGTHALIGGVKGGIQSAKYVGEKIVKPLGKGILSSIGGIKPQVVQEYIEKGSATKNAISPEDAKAMLDQAIFNIQEATKGKRGKFADDVLAAVEKLKEKVNQGSKEAYEILDKNPDKTVRVPDMKSVITRFKKTLEPVKGVEPIGVASQKAYKILNRYREIFDKFPKKITLRQAKMILQQMGHDMTDIESVGGYGSPSHNAVASIRKSLDTVVKKLVPEYEEKMLSVADDTEALIKMNKKFGTLEKVMGKIDRFETASGDLEKKALIDLESRTMSQHELFDNSSRLSNQLEQINNAKPIMMMTSGKTQNFIQSIFNRSSQENKKILKLISEMDGRDLVTLLEDAGTKDAFTKQFNAGSANVNLWTVIGMTAAGGLTGGVTGAIIGSMVKFYGPSTTKLVLDRISSIQGTPTLRKLDRILDGIPPELQLKLKQDLIRGVQTGMGQSVPVLIPQSDYVQTLLDIDRAKNMNTIDKARAIDSLNRDGQVNSQYLSKIILDEGQEIDQNKQIHFKKKESSENNPTEEDKSTVRLEDVAEAIRKSR